MLCLATPVLLHPLQTFGEPSSQVMEFSVNMISNGSQRLRDLERAAKQRKVGIWTNYVPVASNQGKLSGTFIGKVGLFTMCARAPIVMQQHPSLDPYPEPTRFMCPLCLLCPTFRWLKWSVATAWLSRTLAPRGAYSSPGKSRERGYHAQYPSQPVQAHRMPSLNTMYHPYPLLGLS